MIKLALIGKNIGKSQSPVIYREILKTQIHYELIDLPNVKDLHDLDLNDLLNHFDGISVTSPYKVDIFRKSNIRLTPLGSYFGSTNCLKKDGHTIWGTNTDSLALYNLITQLLKEKGTLDFIILGDGAMSVMSQKILRMLKQPFSVFSRKKSKDFSYIEIREKKNSTVVINTCAKDFEYSGDLSEKLIFLDFNYNHHVHYDVLTPQVELYLDGMTLLRLQGLYALKFWEIL